MAELNRGVSSAVTICRFKQVHRDSASLINDYLAQSGPVPPLETGHAIHDRGKKEDVFRPIDFLPQLIEQ